MILKDHPKEKIIEAMENNGIGFNLLIPPNDPKYQKNVNEDMIRVTSELNHVWGNWIVKVRFNAQNAERRITETMKFYREKEIAMMWWITPFSTPENLVSLLKNEGVQIVEQPGMACDLRKLTEEKYKKALNRSQTKIIKVTSVANLKLWKKVLQEGFTIPETVAEMFTNLVSRIKLYNYLAISQKQPVGIASVLYYGGIAGIYNITTVPNYRGQGIGTTIILAPLMDVKQKGYEIAWLEASKMGENLYKRIGFQEYCRFFRGIYTPEGQ